MLYDADNFNAVTSTGQHVLKTSLAYAEKKLGSDAMIAGDTDSIFMRAHEFVKWVNNEWLTEDGKSHSNIFKERKGGGNRLGREREREEKKLG